MSLTVHRDLRQSVYAYYAASLCRNLEFSLPIFVFFFSNYLGLSYTQVSFIAVAYYLSQITFDFALGTYADAFGRKKSYLLGMGIYTLGILPLVLTHHFPILLITAVIMGAGSALASNTLDADLHDALSVKGLEKEYIAITSTSTQFAFVGRVISGIAGALLFVIDPRLPYLAEIVVIAIGMTSVYFLFTQHISQHSRGSARETMRAAFSFLRRREDIMAFCFVGALGVFAGDLLFAYYQPYFNVLQANTILVGATYSVIAIFGILGAHLGKTWVARHSPYSMSNLILWGTITTALLMFVQNQYLAFAATILLAIPFGFSNANLRHFLNSRSPSHIKASIASYGSTLYAAGTMGGMALAGVLADHLTPRVILLIIIGMSVVILIISTVISRRTATEKIAALTATHTP